MAAEGSKHKGNDALKRGEYELAVELYTKAISLFKDPDIPNNGEGVYTSRATVYIKQKKYKKALEDTSFVLNLNPNNSKAYLRIY